MSFKWKYLAGGLGLAGLALGVFLFNAYSTANHFVEAESAQTVDAVSSLRGIDGGGKRIIVLYKKHCRVCKSWDEEVTALLSKVDGTISYLDIEEEIPSEVSSLVSKLPSEVHTPLVMVVDSTSTGYNVAYYKTINSQKSLSALESYLNGEYLK